MASVPAGHGNVPLPSSAKSRNSRSPAALLLRQLFRRRLVVLSFLVMLAILAVALLAPWITPSTR